MIFKSTNTETYSKFQLKIRGTLTYVGRKRYYAHNQAFSIKSQIQK